MVNQIEQHELQSTQGLHQKVQGLDIFGLPTKRKKKPSKSEKEKVTITEIEENPFGES